MSDYWLGMVIGFFAAGIFGFVLYQFRLWRKQWLAMTKPQKAEAVSNEGGLESRKTPVQVISTGLQAGCLILVTLLLIGIILWLLLGSPQ